MGFYSKLRNEEDSPREDENDALEEQYQKLYKKIARDFVHVGDFQKVILDLINDKSFLIALATAATKQKAIAKAIEYKENLEKPKNQRTTYKDILDNKDD
jgi:primosomal protein N''